MFVMLANAGIQVRFQFTIKNRLDSGFRRNDRNKSRLPVSQFRSPRLGAEGRSIVAAFGAYPSAFPFLAQNAPA